MTEAHDENSINTDITFESGDENVSIQNYRQIFQLKMEILCVISIDNVWNSF